MRNAPGPIALDPSAPGEPASATGFVERAIKDCVQELLKTGILDAAHKPHLYAVALKRSDTVNVCLAPLDLTLRIDEVRGLAFLAVSEGYDEGDREQWSHPLVRRQRLNLEQSLLIAILRQHYVAYEVESGIGGDNAVVYLDQLLPELNRFLGDTGSDRQNDKRLRNLLEQLRGYGLVSEVDDNEQVRIRPLIVHVANPENLQGLLAAFRSRAVADQGG